MWMGVHGQLPAPVAGKPSAVRRLLGAFLLAVPVMAAGCGGPRVVAFTPEARAAARATFDAPPDRVFQACIDSLEKMGYSVAVEQPEAAEILTRPMQARSNSPVRGEIPYRRTFVLAVIEAGDGRSIVSAEPLLSRGAGGGEHGATADRAEPRTVWTLDEERAEARRLFAGVRKVLTRPASVDERR